MKQNNISIMLVDDHPLLRKGVVQLIELEDNLEVVAEANNGEDAVKRALELDPDLIMLDLNMKGLNGVETLKAIKQTGVKAKVIMFTVSDAEADVLQALKAGVDGYVLKDSEPEELIQYINKSMQGELVISAPLTQILAKSFRPKAEKEEFLEALTNRETQILRYISQGDSNKVIARKLEIAESTVKVHVKHLLKKINLKSRIEAALFAVENKLF
ncbi:two-component system response regulator NarL [Kangiella koreensis]|uniref:Two component transcriptional regulator, LuxR family n=1 Tax=Kangiella koreensis (strain DSM 16069 / JCM 12317 / KCTC 12182 / SW-125) TaxID=523791 RepID=C7RBW8_KANKD|nr:two-component system response regulator NarL [Kangiella koreensis]ACV26760.1 two component transcriptional regulator, LuxR family [Kangiella koreensis DSM 16069]